MLLQFLTQLVRPDKAAEGAGAAAAADLAARLPRIESTQPL